MAEYWPCVTGVWRYSNNVLKRLRVDVAADDVAARSGEGLAQLFVSASRYKAGGGDSDIMREPVSRDERTWEVGEEGESPSGG